MRVLIGSAIKQDYDILREFLESIKNLESDKIKIDYYFVDDNDDKRSSIFLYDFKKEVTQSTVEIITAENKNMRYLRDDVTHYWTDDLMNKVADIKNKIINYAKEKNYDFLFLVDSDLYLHPMTLKQLIMAEKNIISEIFWTKWSPDSIDLPQVWVSDQYTLFEKGMSEKLTQEVINERTMRFLNMLLDRGIYKVGGLGACTLISKKAINSGLSFSAIYNLSFSGEDRHFCIRAVSLGFELFVDTHWPAFHIYRSDDLKRLSIYKECIKKINGIYKYIMLPYNRRIKISDNRVTLSMVLKNEANRYLKDVLKIAREIVDSAVIIDDASTDNTKEICLKELSGIPVTYIVNKKSMFNNEVELRKRLFNETITKNPDWILCLDADEILEDKIIHKIKGIIDKPYYDTVCFRLYDFWNDHQYRDDIYWNAHKRMWPFLIRYQPYFKYVWREIPVHCGRFPLNIFELPTGTSEIRVKHMGWANEEDRLLKYNRYMQLDGDGKYGILEQYKSILDKNVNLRDWED
ncbi:glycosyltransferase [Thermoanaerobacterium sp. RBIITD]|uniref:glycosyltransferase n=1 Tax=Thermoanaerobacterium sp. RBIITD TaxID=1550240 RepID=UPI000BB7812B|nr:glycosyltransferase [Thermoanaerobacterium sp. RBIITD]SNX55179.1 Glycosyl transferase family 2 [Thermoanaerobacterium sp. RBIITD]